MLFLIKSNKHIKNRVSQKNLILTLKANILGLQAPIGKFRTSFENYMISAFIWAQKQVHSVQVSLGKSGSMKLS